MFDTLTGFLSRCWESNLGPYACTTSVSPTEPISGEDCRLHSACDLIKNSYHYHGRLSRSWNGGEWGKGGQGGLLRQRCLEGAPGRHCESSLDLCSEGRRSGGCTNLWILKGKGRFLWGAETRSGSMEIVSSQCSCHRQGGDTVRWTSLLRLGPLVKYVEWFKNHGWL